MWVYETQNKVYTIIKHRTEKELKAKYPKLNFTKEEEATTVQNDFPTVFIKFLNSGELAQSLKGNNINAFTCAIQIEVTTNKTQGLNVAEKVIWQTVESAKKSGFELFYSPEPMKTGNDTKRIVARMRRVIGYRDVIK